MSEETPIQALVGIGAALIPEVAIAESRAIGSADGLLRRGYVRAVFALIEGLNYARLFVSRKSTHLTDEQRSRADLAVFREKHALRDTDDGGVPSSTRKSFAAFAAVHGVSNPLTPAGDDWENFLAAVSVRNRITHPRGGADCCVSEQDFALVRRAHRWYQDLDQCLLRAAGTMGG